MVVQVFYRLRFANDDAASGDNDFTQTDLLGFDRSFDTSIDVVGVYGDWQPVPVPAAAWLLVY